MEELAPTAPPKSIKAEQQRISQLHGALWECVGCEQSSSGVGYNYKFKLRDEYNDITPHPDRSKRNAAQIEKMNAIYPALESSGMDMLHKLSVGIGRIGNYSNELGQLGYKYEYEAGVYLYLPDREALLASWDKLRENRPELPPLDIQESDGIADDLDFVKAYFTHDGLLSSGKEFLHDQHFHIIPLITLLLSSEQPSLSGTNPSYKQTKASIVKILSKTYHRILMGRELCKTNILNIPEEELALLKKHLPKIETLLGIFVDYISAESSYSGLSSWKHERVYADNAFFNPWINPQSRWRSYLEKKFGSLCDQTELIAVEAKLKEYEQRLRQPSQTLLAKLAPAVAVAAFSAMMGYFYYANLYSEAQT